MIGFISSGLNPPESLTIEETEFLEKCTTIVVDTYTSPNFMKQYKDRNLVFVTREKMENFEWILDQKGNVGIVIPGESFSATTHFIIYREALKRGLGVRIFHNASVFPTAATAMGLHLYKVGPAISLPRFTENFKPLSPYEKILDNRRRGLHTILLLDTDPPLSLGDALVELQFMENSAGMNLFRDESEIGVVSCLGMPEERIIFGTIKKIKEAKSPTPPITIIVPGELHFQEREAVELFRE